jgi:hypothetical protein
MSDEGPFSSHRPRTLVIELAVILILLAAAGVTIYLVTRPKAVHTERRLAGDEQEVSNNDRTQYGPALAIDPSNHRVLLAGSTDDLDDTRVYQSTDGGESWSSTPGPPTLRAACNRDLPAVAIDPGGRQLFAFTVTEFCDFQTPKLHVASRAAPNGHWRVAAVAPVRGYAADRHVHLAAAGSTAYAAWVRKPRRYSETVFALLSRSDDGGKTWAAPLRLPARSPLDLALAATRRGAVYVAVADGATGRLELMRSVDGGRSFGAPRVVARLHSLADPTCQGLPLPPQPRTCVSPAPSLALTSSGQVVVAWTDADPNTTGGVRVASFSPALEPVLEPRRIGPPDAKPSDQFDAALAVDASTGDLWACYEDTFGDPYRRQAWPTCTLSRDAGRRWAGPVRVAAKSSDETETAAVIYGYGSVAVAAADGDAHVMWTDTRKLLKLDEEIYAATVRADDLP